MFELLATEPRSPHPVIPHAVDCHCERARERCRAWANTGRELCDASRSACAGAQEAFFPTAVYPYSASWASARKCGRGPEKGNLANQRMKSSPNPLWHKGLLAFHRRSHLGNFKVTTLPF